METQGTPLAKITSPASTFMAGKVSMCLKAWKDLTLDPWILEVVEGYRLELESRPYQLTPTPSEPVPGTQRKLIEKEVQTLLQKGAIERVSQTQDQFVSRIFVIPKKDGSHRPVFNLRPLNQFIKKCHFKMEGMTTVKELVQKEDWFCTIDLKDAYLSVAVNKDHRKYLRFMWAGKTFQFTCLPFGLCSAPRVFTKLLRPVMTHLRKQGIRSVIYLDDLLLMDQRKDYLTLKVAQVVELLESLGFMVNREKSQLSPLQEIPYLGFVVDSKSMMFRLSQEKVAHLSEHCNQTLDKGPLSVRELAKVVGSLSATRQAVFPAPLYYRHLQQLITQSLRQNPSFNTMVSLDAGARKDLEWWTHHLNNWNGRDIQPRMADFLMETDASKIGWGANCEGTRTGGYWSPQEQCLHINCLELQAGTFAMKAFMREQANVHVHLRMDNQSAVSYINKMGGPSLSV